MKFRWWLASILVAWAHRLTENETGLEPIWLQEFAIAYVRSRI